MADGESVEVPLKVKTSDLPVRVASAVVMVAVAAGALFAGGFWLDAFIIVVATATLAELVLLVLKAVQDNFRRAFAVVGGVLYIGLAAWHLIGADGFSVFTIVFAVVGVDSLAYFAGRTFGGPKIAPSISPSKTWAGLAGGIGGAALALVASSALYAQFYGTSLCQTYYDWLDSFEPDLPPGLMLFDDRCNMAYAALDLTLLWQSLVVGLLIAVVAQTGDFLESWIKRKAGVKDSSRLIPGHGGLFDRVDGLLAVAFVLQVVRLVVAAVWP